MTIDCFWEHNGDSTLLYAIDCVGAYTRGENKQIALNKMEQEVLSYLRWANCPLPEKISIQIAEEKDSELNVSDADSDALFSSEALPLDIDEYIKLKELALKSAKDFLDLYLSIPNANISTNQSRTTFYGKVPQTATEMYEHTKNVNTYYFAEIGIEADNEGTIYECRKRAFETLEKSADFLNNSVVEGSYGELWSLRKVIRRFIWHDRIHAKAMCRMAKRTFGVLECNPYGFEI